MKVLVRPAKDLPGAYVEYSCKGCYKGTKAERVQGTRGAIFVGVCNDCDTVTIYKNSRAAELNEEEKAAEENAKDAICTDGKLAKPIKWSAFFGGSEPAAKPK